MVKIIRFNKNVYLLPFSATSNFSFYLQCFSSVFFFFFSLRHSRKHHFNSFVGLAYANELTIKPTLTLSVQYLEILKSNSDIKWLQFRLQRLPVNYT